MAFLNLGSPGLGILQDFFEQLTAGFWRFVLFAPMPAIFGVRTGIVLIGQTVGTNRQPVPNDSIHLFLILAFFQFVSSLTREKQNKRLLTGLPVQ